jgi:hypothetical protein
MTTQAMNQPKADCEALMNALLPFAEQMLQRYGEFFPLGGAMRPDGEIVSVAAHDSGERPSSADVIRQLKEVFVAAACDGQYKATGLAYDVKATIPSTGEKSDAIAISLNHRDNYSIIVLFPYKLSGGSLTIGDAFAEAGEADVFSSHYRDKVMVVRTHINK